MALWKRVMFRWKMSRMVFVGPLFLFASVGLVVTHTKHTLYGTLYLHSPFIYQFALKFCVHSGSPLEVQVGFYLFHCVFLFTRPKIQEN